MGLATTEMRKKETSARCDGMHLVVAVSTNTNSSRMKRLLRYEQTVLKDKNK